MNDETDNETRPQVAAQIDENLRRVYADVIEGDVPDRFKNLIERLKAQDTTTGAGE